MTETMTLTEAQIQAGLREALETLGFSVYHTAFAIRSDGGFPDLVAIRARDGALVAIECKGPRGRLRPGQWEWIERFRSVPGCLLAAVVGPTTTRDRLSYDDALALIQEAN